MSSCRVRMGPRPGAPYAEAQHAAAIITSLTPSTAVARTAVNAVASGAALAVSPRVGRVAGLAAATATAFNVGAAGQGSSLEPGITYTTYQIPASIDTTGATEVSEEIYSWFISTVPSGADETHHSRVIPQPGATYKIDLDLVALTRLQISGTRNHITFDGLGYWSSYPFTQTGDADATKRSAVETAYAAFRPNPASYWVPGATWNFYTADLRGREDDGVTPKVTGFASLFFLQSTEDIQICGWTADGLNPYVAVGGRGAGTQYSWYAAGYGHENDIFVQIRGNTSNIRVHDNYVHRWHGFSVTTNNTGSSVHPDDIQIYRNNFWAAEMGMAVIDGTNIDIRNNVLRDSLYSAFDIESEQPTDVVSDVFFRWNVIDTHSLDNQGGDGWFFAANPDGGSDGCRCDRITVSDNYVYRGIVAGQDPDNNHNIGGLSTRVQRGNGNPSAVAKTDIVITRNWTGHAAGNAGPSDYDAVFNIENVVGLQITHNRQPLTGGSYVLVDTSNVSGTVDTTTGNVTT